MLRFLLLAFCGLIITSARAELVIEITRGADDATPVAIVPFTGPSVSGQASLNSIISADLAGSGRFRTLVPEEMPKNAAASPINYADWADTQAYYALTGKVILLPDGQYEIRYELFNITQQTRLLGEKLTIRSGRWRDAAHFISDKVFEKITGVRGAFSTRIVYVNQYSLNNDIRYRLELSDADGYRPMTILDSSEPILSPSWSPDSKKIAYVSFEGQRPSIFIQTIATRERVKLASFSGLNGAPSWSPDGKSMALVLSRDGNPEIYLMDIATRALTRLTEHYAIDTEPRWMPDGKGLIFTSDRGGSAQIYQLNIADRSVRRLTFEGNYNGRADISPDGRLIAFVHRESGQQFKIAVQDLTTGVLTPITQTPLDESPSFSPNGLSLVYATRNGRYGELGIATVDARFKLRLPARLGEVREPAWSPFSN